MTPRFEDLTALLRHQAEERGGQTALIDRDRTVSYAELEQASAGLAGGLARLGVTAGDRVALWLPNLAAWMVSFLACCRLGAIAVSVNTRFRAGEVADIVGRSGCRLLIFWPGFKGIDFAGILAGVDRERLPGLRDIVAYDEGDALAAKVHGLPLRRYAELEMANAADAPSTGMGKAAGNAPCVIFSTSGTTRAPKFVLHDQRTLLLHARDAAAAFGYEAPDAVILVTAPLCGVFGFCNAMAALFAGRPLVMTPVFDAAELALVINRHRVTHTNATNEAIAQLLAQAADGERPYPSARVFGFADFTPGYDTLVADAERRGLRLVGLYGSSELQALLARQPEDEPAERRQQAGGVLVSAQGRVRAVDPQTRQVQAPGVAGELEFKVPSRMLGYYGDPQATAEAMADDGWFRSGDLGYTVDERRFVFLSRLGDALRLGGFLVNPLEIEETVQELPGIAGCQVVGVDLAEGTRPVAFVTLAAGGVFDEAEAIAHCRGRLAKFKAPLRVFRVEEFPVTPGANASKVQKNRLRDLALELLRR